MINERCTTNRAWRYVQGRPLREKNDLADVEVGAIYRETRCRHGGLGWCAMAWLRTVPHTGVRCLDHIKTAAARFPTRIATTFGGDAGGCGYIARKRARIARASLQKEHHSQQHCREAAHYRPAR